MLIILFYLRFRKNIFSGYAAAETVYCRFKQQMLRDFQTVDDKALFG